MSKAALLIFCIGLFFFGCKKEEPLSEVPEITLLNVGPQIIKAYEDSIYFSIAYKDGDGDLGDTDPLAKNLFIQDHRINLTYEYRIAELVPGGASVGIQGQLNMAIANTVLTRNSEKESVYYRIWVTDRAGNRSNTLVIGPLQVIK